jgi:hypothetical protein
MARRITVRLPGIDISDSAALQEMDDIEYIERLKNGFK